MDNLLTYRIALSLLPGVGPVSARNLMAACGDIDNIFRKSKKELLKIPGIGAGFADIISKYGQQVMAYAEKEVGFIESNNINTLYFTEPEYPRRLKECPDAPLLLYYKGKIKEYDPVLSVVGTRKASHRGRDFTHKLVNDLHTHDIQPLIVSGLAFGIDASAHRAALEEGLPTWGIMGHGFDLIYPAAHRQLYQDILDNGGALLTEFSSIHKKDKVNFVRRNRIIAGLSDAVVVVESRKKGGAMITADLGMSYNREVFAVPGRPNDINAGGCNHLIKTNRAALCESADDLIYVMNWNKKPKSEKAHQTKMEIEIPLKESEKQIVDMLRELDYIDIDKLCQHLELSLTDASAHLLTLELKGIVKALPGKIFALR